LRLAPKISEALVKGAILHVPGEADVQVADHLLADPSPRHHLAKLEEPELRLHAVRGLMVGAR